MAALALCLAGCVAPTVNQPGTGGPGNWSSGSASHVTATNHPVAPPQAKIVLPPVTHYYPYSPAPTNPPPAFKLTPLPPATTWTSLDGWALSHNVSAPRRLSVSPVVSYAVHSDHGTMVLEIGSRDATWNGTLVHLGFAPEMIDNQIFVHALDLEKNLIPLLCETPVLPLPPHIIVIDPGHGGTDSGALSVIDGRPEKYFTLDVARRLVPLLEAKGWHVVLTRTGDIDVGVTNRAIFAVEHHADLFVSLHFNSSAPDHKQSGLETYCLTPTGMPSTITRGYPDLVYQNFPVNAFDDRSLWLGLRLHSALLRATGEEDRGVRRARFLGVLRWQACPAVLIEGGYLSNLHDAREIEDPQFRQKYAEAIAAAIP